MTTGQMWPTKRAGGSVGSGPPSNSERSTPMPGKSTCTPASIQAPANTNKVAETFVPIGDAAKALLAKHAAKRIR